MFKVLYFLEVLYVLLVLYFLALLSLLVVLCLLEMQRNKPRSLSLKKRKGLLTFRKLETDFTYQH